MYTFGVPIQQYDNVPSRHSSQARGRTPEGVTRWREKGGRGRGGALGVISRAPGADAEGHGSDFGATFLACERGPLALALHLPR